MFKVNDLKPEWSAKVAANVANVEAKVRAKLKREWKSSGGVDPGYGRRESATPCLRNPICKYIYIYIYTHSSRISGNLN